MNFRRVSLLKLAGLLVLLVALTGLAACGDMEDGEGTSGELCTPECQNGFSCEGGLCLRTGDLRFRMSWDVSSDYDLHVVAPDGTELNFMNRTGANGELDHDDTSGGSGSVENIAFQSPQQGEYQVWARNYDGAVSGQVTIDVITSGGTQESWSATLPAETTNTQVWTYNYP